MGDTQDYCVLAVHPPCRVTKTVKKSRYYCVNCGAKLRWDRYGGVCSENEMGHSKGGDWVEIRKKDV